MMLRGFLASRARALLLEQCLQASAVAQAADWQNLLKPSRCQMEICARHVALTDHLSARFGLSAAEPQVWAAGADRSPHCLFPLSEAPRVLPRPSRVLRLRAISVIPGGTPFSLLARGGRTPRRARLRRPKVTVSTQWRLSVLVRLAFVGAWGI